MNNDLTEEYLKADKIGNSHIEIIISVPRSGKTTYANLRIKEGYIPVCRDDIRRALGVRFKTSLEDDVHRYAKVMLECLLIRGVPKIIIDECNVTKKSRRKIIELAKKYDATWKFTEIPSPDETTHREICAKTDFDWAIIENFKRIYEPIEDSELCPNLLN